MKKNGDKKRKKKVTQLSAGKPKRKKRKKKGTPSVLLFLLHLSCLPPRKSSCHLASSPYFIYINQSPSGICQIYSSMSLLHKVYWRRAIWVSRGGQSRPPRPTGHGKSWLNRGGHLLWPAVVKVYLLRRARYTAKPPAAGKPRFTVASRPRRTALPAAGN